MSVFADSLLTGEQNCCVVEAVTFQELACLWSVGDGQRQVLLSGQQMLVLIVVAGL